MKKTALILILLGISTSITFAQFKQGTFLVGGSGSGSIDFNTSKSKSGGTTTTTGKSSSFSLAPAVGYFVTDKISVGTEIGISLESYKSQINSFTANSTTVSVSPFVRYYFDKLYGQASYSVGSSKSKQTGDGTQTFTTSLSGWSLLAGYVIPLNETVMLEPQLGYGSTSSGTSTSKSINNGLFARVGVFVYISR